MLAVQELLEIRSELMETKKTLEWSGSFLRPQGKVKPKVDVRVDRLEKTLDRLDEEIAAL